jgi:hypothetical protein
MISWRQPFIIANEKASCSTLQTLAHGDPPVQLFVIQHLAYDLYELMSY